MSKQRGQRAGGKYVVPGYKLTSACWRDLPWPHAPGSRALVHQRYEAVPEREPTKRSKKARRGPGLGDAFGPATANEREKRITAGAHSGGQALQRKREAEIAAQLEREPMLRTYGTRTLVTGNVVRVGHKPSFLVRCTCGSEQHVPCGAWLNRGSGVGKTCMRCASKSGKKTPIVFGRATRETTGVFVIEAPRVA